jgi:hypothetical protein
VSETRSARDHQRLHGCRRRGCSQCLAATPVRRMEGNGAARGGTAHGSLIKVGTRFVAVGSCD